MKQGWITVVLALALGGQIIFAQTGEVYSVNVVGFQKLTAVSQGLVLVSTPFVRSPNTLDDVIGPQLTGGKSQASADEIAFWDAQSQTYKRYWLKNDGYWYTAGQVPERATNTSITPKDGFWIRNRSSTNREVIVSGDVVDDAIITNQLVTGLNLVSYPFSTEININGSGLTNGTASKTQSLADELTLWDQSSQSYKRYWLKSPERKWFTVGISPTEATNVYVGGGKAFWYRNRSSTPFNWVEARPYTL